MGKVTWGKGTDGRWHVRHGLDFLASFGSEGGKRAARVMAESIAGGARRTLETVYTIPVDEPHPPPAEESASAATDLSVLSLSIPKLEAALETGKHDAYLQALWNAEDVGKERKGAYDALEAMGDFPVH